MPDPTLRDLPPEEAYQLACEARVTLVCAAWNETHGFYERLLPNGDRAAVVCDYDSRGKWYWEARCARPIPSGKAKSPSAAMAAADAALLEAGAILVGGVPE